MTEKDLEIQELRQRIAGLERELKELRELVPVMPGDTVYRLTGRRRELRPWQVKSIEIDEFGRSVLKFGWYKDHLETAAVRRRGETWFLTREEAEEVYDAAK